jgi:hypothetical protein
MKKFINLFSQIIKWTADKTQKENQRTTKKPNADIKCTKKAVTTEQQTSFLPTTRNKNNRCLILKWN